MSLLCIKNLLNILKVPDEAKNKRDEEKKKVKLLFSLKYAVSQHLCEHLKELLQSFILRICILTAY